MLQIIFGDDEHTASDGPYARILKTRKWLYLSSAAGIAVASGLYDEHAATSIVRVFRLPTDAIEQALVFGVGYLLVQYALLMLQLVATYDIVLTERFAFRRADDLAAARLALKEVTRESSVAMDGYLRDKTAAFERVREDTQAALSAAEADLEAALELAEASGRQGATGDEIKQALHLASRGKAVLAHRRSELGRLEDPAALAKKARPEHDPTVKAAQEKVEEASSVLLKLQRQVPSMRWGYRASETLIDALRMLPPFALACVALALLIR